MQCDTVCENHVAALVTALNSGHVSYHITAAITQLWLQQQTVTNIKQASHNPAFSTSHQQLEDSSIIQSQYDIIVSLYHANSISFKGY